MEDLIQKYINKIENALDIASDVVKNPDSMRTKLNDFLLHEMRGKSSKEMRIFFNELMDNETTFLQIGGVSFGHLLLPALFENNVKYTVAIDHYGGPLFDTTVYDHLMQLSYYHSLDVDENFFIIKERYFELKEEDKVKLNKHKFNIFFYNGEPRLDFHIKKFTEFYENFDDIFIFMTSNTEKHETLDGTHIGLQKCNLKIIKDWNLEPVGNYKKPGKLSWHNGLYVAILQK